jgi:hypothetical protein
MYTFNNPGSETTLLLTADPGGEWRVVVTINDPGSVTGDLLLAFAKMIAVAKYPPPEKYHWLRDLEVATASATAHAPQDGPDRDPNAR